MNRIVRSIGSFAAFALGLLAGCANGGPTFYAVSGKVTLKDGTPIPYGQIAFHPDRKRGNPSQDVCQATIRNGVYTLKTGAFDGAPPGLYRVSIEAAAGASEAQPYFKKWLAHEKYLNADRSQLTADVVSRPEPGRYDFTLDPSPKKR